MKSAVKRPVVSRAERALATRRRMLASARDLFIEQGYAGTTVEQIAADAGVAVQTVYYTFRTKGLLLRELVEVTAAGEEPAVPVMGRAWAREMLSATSAQRVLALAVEHGTAIYERVSPLWPAVTAAAGADPDVTAYWQAVGAGRRDGQRQLVARLVGLDALRPGLDPERATDLVMALAGPRRVPEPGDRSRLVPPDVPSLALHHRRAAAARPRRARCRGNRGPVVRRRPSRRRSLTSAGPLQPANSSSRTGPRVGNPSKASTSPAPAGQRGSKSPRHQRHGRRQSRP